MVIGHFKWQYVYSYEIKYFQNDVFFFFLQPVFDQVSNLKSRRGNYGTIDI